MGKQILFFSTVIDEEALYNEMKKDPDLIFYNPKAIEGLKPITNYSQSNDIKIFITRENSIIKMRGDYIDETSSEVIEFSKSYKTKDNDNEIYDGRLWFEQKFWNNGNEVIKPTWLNEVFQKYARWIRKNYRKSKDGRFYIGPDAYQAYLTGQLRMKNSPLIYIEF